MCVRYTFHRPDEALAAITAALAWKLAPLPDWAKPRFNVTLTHIVPVVATGTDGPEARGMVWGLVPFYERGKPQRRMLPNAKAETAASLTAFKQGVAKRRCLVPANGFYEWQSAGKLKLPHLFTLKNEEPFSFAGIWEPPEDDTPGTFSILTTAPNELVAPIHISSAGVPSNSDHLHFTADGQREMGRRYAVQMLKVMGYEAKEPKEPYIKMPPPAVPTIPAAAAPVPAVPAPVKP